MDWSLYNAKLTIYDCLCTQDVMIQFNFMPFLVFFFLHEDVQKEKIAMA